MYITIIKCGLSLKVVFHGMYFNGFRGDVLNCRRRQRRHAPGPEVIKLFSCSAQLIETKLDLAHEC